MEKITKKSGVTPTVTRAEKRETAKNIIRELLKRSSYKASELIDEASKAFVERFADEKNEDINGVKGRIGSLIDLMKKEEIVFDGGVYALKVAEQASVKAEETVVEKTPKTKKTTRKTAKKADTEKTKKTEETTETEESTAPKKRASKKKKTEENTEKIEKEQEQKQEEKEEAIPLPVPPMQPVVPVAPITPETAPEPIPPKKSAPKKRARKTAKTKQAETVETVETPKEALLSETQVERNEDLKENTQLMEKAKAELAPKGTLMDMSFLFGDIKQPKKELKKEPVAEKSEKSKIIEKAETTEETKVTVKKPQEKPQKPQELQEKAVNTVVQKRTANTPAKRGRTLTADERLQEAFLKRLHRLGGEYFEYYSVYLLEKYSRMNGRRLEGLRITGGDHDGGIDGEIELTDRLGFRETIYIQAKNWDPDKGDEKLWVVGETLLQQFIGACVCRQAKDKKQHCRGIFITTSRFTPEAKRILEETSDKFVGYDGNDLYETAKECAFGLIKRNGEWCIDEELLSSEKALFNIR